MNIDTLEAGPELDALVAEKVMGWTRIPEDKQEPHGDHKEMWWDEVGRCYCGVPLYSNHIANAWQVVEKILKDFDLDTQKGESLGFSLECHTESSAFSPRGADYEDDWLCTLPSVSIPAYETMNGDFIKASAPTAPLAICRAALKAVGA